MTQRVICEINVRPVSDRVTGKDRIPKRTQLGAFRVTAQTKSEENRRDCLK